MKHRFKHTLMTAALAFAAVGAHAGTLNIELDFEKFGIKLANEVVKGGYKLITAEDVKKMLDAKEDVVLIDAHPKWEYEMAYIDGAKNFGFQSNMVGDWDKDVTDGPRTQEDYRAVLGADKNKKIIIYCGFTKCGRSHNAATWAKQLGYTNIYRMPGGITAWKELGYAYKVVPNANHAYPNK